MAFLRKAFPAGPGDAAYIRYTWAANLFIDFSFFFFGLLI